MTAAGGDRPQYDQFADSYADENENSLFNRWYERPEILRLVGDVDGLRVLDAGCGHGPLIERLRACGAQVSGFDLSPAMVALARERLGADADVRVGDLSDPLPYPDDEFDLVTCSLALHYVEDWSRPLAEFRRVIRPGGQLVISVIHPFLFAALRRDEDYFAHVRYSEDYEFAGRTAVLTYWHRPLQDVVSAVVDAGFAIRRMTEPGVHPETPSELLPDGHRRFISFLFLDLGAPSADVRAQTTSPA